MKIAIVGTAPSSRSLAPFNDPDWQIWVTGAANKGFMPRVDAWFEMHPLSIFENDPRMLEYLAWLSIHPKLYLIEQSDQHPNGELYPKDEMIAKYGAYWFTSSVAWMLALAIEQKPEVIGFWGVDMASDDEYVQQKAGCYRFIEIAREKGIEVVVSERSDLMATAGPYGYRQQSPMHQKLEARREELAARLAEAERNITINTRVKHTMEGAIQDVDYMLRTWVP